MLDPGHASRTRCDCSISRAVLGSRSGAAWLAREELDPQARRARYDERMDGSPATGPHCRTTCWGSPSGCGRDWPTSSRGWTRPRTEIHGDLIWTACCSTWGPSARQSFSTGRWPAWGVPRGISCSSSSGLSVSRIGAPAESQLFGMYLARLFDNGVRGYDRARLRDECRLALLLWFSGVVGWLLGPGRAWSGRAPCRESAVGRPPRRGVPRLRGRLAPRAVRRGAEGGNRTHTARRPPDFESGASASSATSACERGHVNGVLRGRFRLDPVRRCTDTPGAVTRVPRSADGGGSIEKAQFARALRVARRARSPLWRRAAAVTTNGAAEGAGLGFGALPSSSCTGIEYKGDGDPDYLIVSDLLFRARAARRRARSSAPSGTCWTSGWKAGDHKIAFQSCDDATAQAGKWSPASARRTRTRTPGTRS